MALFWRDFCMTYTPNYKTTDDLLANISKPEVLRYQIDASNILPEREIEMRYHAIRRSNDSWHYNGWPFADRRNRSFT